MAGHLKLHNGYGHLDTTWMKQGLCRWVEDPDIFFPSEGFVGKDDQDAAKAVCNGCPVRRDCLEYALLTRQAFGIWGGFNARERKRMLKIRARRMTT
jgi:WhiB family redox-sensing transcriptional regulator